MIESLRASIVIPTHGRCASLLQVLQALGHQDVSPHTFEVVVVCDGDVDGSVVACRTLASTLPYILRIVEQANQGPAAARNRGIDAARAPLIIFLDDDVVPDRRLVVAHLNAQANQDCRVVIGPLLPPPDVHLNAWGEWEERTLMRQYRSMESGRWRATYRQFYTGNASVLKRHLIEAGGFNSSFRRAEDVELALRLRDRGVQFYFLPEARGIHYVQRAFDSWLRMPVAYGAADVAMARAGRPEILATVAHEFPYRRHAIRTLIRICAGRPMVTSRAIIALGLLARGADVIKARLLGIVLCSLIFNLAYYEGLTNALGGREAFKELLSGTNVTALMQSLDDLEPVRGV